MGILLIIIIVTILLGRYAIREGRRIEEHNRFIKNMTEYDEKKKAGKQKSKV